MFDALRLRDKLNWEEARGSGYDQHEAIEISVLVCIFRRGKGQNCIAISASVRLQRQENLTSLFFCYKGLVGENDEHVDFA